MVEQEELEETEAQEWMDENFVFCPLGQTGWSFDLELLEDGYFDGMRYNHPVWLMALRNRFALDSRVWNTKILDEKPTINDYATQTFQMPVFHNKLTEQSLRATMLELVKVMGRHEPLEWFTENGKMVEDPHE
jgi:hypothetical protein